MKNRIIVLLLLASAAFSHARERASFDFGWKFQLGDAPGAEKPTFDDSSWRKLDLPHDFSIESKIDESNPSGRRGGWYGAGIGWYRKEFDFSRDWKNKKVGIYFEGVFRNAKVWVNGKEFDERPYGYISFFCDITSCLKEGGNTIAVRVDNSEQPSDRWYSGSGIYRHVWLVVTEKVYVPPWGIQVTTPRMDGIDNVVVDTRVLNESGKPAKITLKTVIVDATGKKVAEEEWESMMDAGGDTGFLQKLTVKNPLRWSPEDPNLYTVKTIVKSGFRKSDTYETPLGFRTIEWDAEKGFILNGKPTLLKGVSQHHDYGPLGSAEFDDVCESRILKLKEMGCNAMRTAHNPFSPTFMEACDRLGMLVMDECFDGWHKKADKDYGALHFKDWWKRDLRDFILRDRNHPCVFIWSIGNETGYHDEHDMTGFIKQFDPTRKTTGGRCHTGVDIPGFNGEGGSPGFFDKEAEGNRPAIFTEVPHTYCTRGFYRTHTYFRDKKKPRYPAPNLTEKEVFLNDWAEDHIYKVSYNSNYDNAQVRINIRQSWQNTRDHGWVCGEFRWTGHDYLGESFGWPMRGLKNGVIDACNFEKDVFYLYQSQWTEKPMLHILPHWTHPHIAEGTKIPVYAYSNCDEVELFLNGKSLGTDKPGTVWNEMQCDWMVPWQPGELKAVGKKDGKTITHVFRTTAEPAKLKIENDTRKLAADGHDMAQITVSSVDVNGGFAPLANNRVHFHLTGGAELYALGNGDPFDHETTVGATSRRMLSGMCKAFVRSIKGNDDSAQLAVGAILGDRTLKQSNKVYLDVQTIALRGKAKAEYQILYSIDGSEPSLEYTEPFSVKEGTVVKASVLSGGKKLFSMEDTFTSKNWIEYKPSETADNPISKNVAGTWENSDGRKFGIYSAGKVMDLSGGKRKQLGTWWYRDPTDEFEDAAMDVDHGEILWKDGKKSLLRLMLPDTKTLRIKVAGKAEMFTRSSSTSKKGKGKKKPANPVPAVAGIDLSVEELIKSTWKNESNGKPFVFKADGTVVLDKKRKAKWELKGSKYEFTWPSGKTGLMTATDRDTLVIKESNTTILKRVAE